jgi:voltage-gated potassium channel
MLERLRSGLRSWLPATLSNGFTTIGLLAMIVGTSPAVGESGHSFLFGTVIFIWGLIAAQFVVGFWTAPARRAYLVSAEGLIDLAAALALPVGWLLTSGTRDASLFALIWVLRYIRHATGLAFADFREHAGGRPEIINLIEAEGKRRRETNAAMAHV